ncbi:MAG: dephospho-CoA kinase, partial [Muribaculaceae bacterium]|nr:dephospho-CoA kinase [Muribaculaceae bacterium]
AVYDCDLEAKRIMDGSREVLDALNLRYGEEVCPVGGPICRPELAKRVFGSEEERMWLNSLVHRLVREDVARWHAYQMRMGAKRCFVESAILATSGLAQMCDEIWMVTAGEKVRIERIMQRDSLDEEAIRKRIQSQEEEDRAIANSGIPVKIIDNSGNLSLLDQIS